MLGELYKEAMKLMREGVRKVLRRMCEEDDSGTGADAQWHMLVDPWEEEEFIADTVKGYEAPWRQPQPCRVRRATRGSQIKASLTYKHV